MHRYLEVLFIGRCVDGLASRIFEVTLEEFSLLKQNLMALEDEEASTSVVALFRKILEREPAPLTPGDRLASMKRGELVNLEYRGR